MTLNSKYGNNEAITIILPGYLHCYLLMITRLLGFTYMDFHDNTVEHTHHGSNVQQVQDKRLKQM
jgi:hypothetical protein